MEKSGFFTKCWKFWKHLCNTSENHGILKHNQRYPGRISIKFERNKVLLKVHFVCALLGFSLNFGWSLLWTTSAVDNKAILSLKQYCMHCYVIHSNVFYLFQLELCGDQGVSNKTKSYNKIWNLSLNFRQISLNFNLNFNWLKTLQRFTVVTRF